MGVEWEFYALFCSTVFSAVLLEFYVQLLLWLCQAMRVNVYLNNQKKLIIASLRRKNN